MQYNLNSTQYITLYNSSIDANQSYKNILISTDIKNHSIYYNTIRDVLNSKDINWFILFLILGKFNFK
jgi:hypothetical protein